jgi:hypothetical protein
MGITDLVQHVEEKSEFRDKTELILAHVTLCETANRAKKIQHLSGSKKRGQVSIMSGG